ncbi:MFS transporter [Peribacillus cavernae]|uniref:MFS transporter n=1 Tax=Peribacillus cavernae TaxID=1674310 RepID=A0A3S0U2B3_9BACI|nr:MFS transporter [Peribacillus cavernae]MDQ0217902.1 MFS family permease [Peribacillus cavernae]RUQ32561.1 MFS transporter [Peribacillus cavernae]
MTSVLQIFQHEKHYLRLFLAGIINGIGDRFSQVALLALLLELTGSGFAVGAALAIRVVPFLLFGPYGGLLADRLSRKKILIITDLSRIAFAISFVFVNDETHIWLIYLSTFVLGAGEAIYAPARKSLIPLLVKKDTIIKINSLEQIMLGLVLIGGSFSGGIVTYFFGPDMAFWLNGISFLLAAVILLPLSVIQKSEHARGNNKQRAGSDAFYSIKTIRKLMLASSPFYIVCLFEMIVPVFNGIDNVLISVYAVQEFGLGNMGVGFFYGAIGLGLVLSFIVTQRIHQHLLISGLAALLAEGIFIVILSKIHIALIAFLTYVLISFVSGIGNACIDSIVMKETPQEHLGLVFGLLTAISNTLIGLSMFGSGLLLEAVDNRTLGFIGGLAFVLTALFLFVVYSLKQKTFVCRKKEHC